MIYYDFIDSPIGPLLATAEDGALTGIYMEGHQGGPAVSPGWMREPNQFDALHAQIHAYFDGRLTQFTLPLSLRGTAFQKAVWRHLQSIPFGGTVTYGELARRLGAPNASRAVGAAVGRNPISIVVPCHRVLGSGGAITGYAGGIARKRMLLDLEGRSACISDAFDLVG